MYELETGAAAVGARAADALRPAAGHVYTRHTRTIARWNRTVQRGSCAQQRITRGPREVCPEET